MPLINRIDVVHAELLEQDLLIIAGGLVTSTGWSQSRLVPRDRRKEGNGVLEFDFIAEAPKEKSAAVNLPIFADYWWTKDVSEIETVKIYGKTNELQNLVIGRTPPALSTRIAGEEHPLTTLVVGEEHPITTFAIGEEGPTKPNWEHFPTSILVELNPTHASPGEHVPSIPLVEHGIGGPVPPGAPVENPFL